MMTGFGEDLIHLFLSEGVGHCEEICHERDEKLIIFYASTEDYGDLV